MKIKQHSYSCSVHVKAEGQIITQKNYKMTTQQKLFPKKYISIFKKYFAVVIVYKNKQIIYLN
jgi:hypothetical protein